MMAYVDWLVEPNPVRLLSRRVARRVVVEREAQGHDHETASGLDKPASDLGVAWVETEAGLTVEVSRSGDARVIEIPSEVAGDFEALAARLADELG